jgi:hypothetical protein
MVLPVRGTRIDGYCRRLPSYNRQGGKGKKKDTQTDLSWQSAKEREKNEQKVDRMADTTRCDTPTAQKDM